MRIRMAKWFIQKYAKHLIGFDWVHIRIAQPGLGITLAIFKGRLHKFENEFLYKFLIACREWEVSAVDVKISVPTPI